MAVFLRSFRSPPPSEFVGGNRTSEKVVFLAFRKRKVTMVSRKELLSNESKLLETAIYTTKRFREALNDCALSGHCNVILNQRKALINFTRSLVFANASMLILPLDALAEACEAGNSFFNMPLLFGIALIGATVGGLLARQRKGELKRLNDQLRQINEALRRQAKIESYAPNLSYAPISRVAEAEVIVDPRKHELITKLRSGKNYLRNQDLEKAYNEFKAAIELAQALGDHVEEKKAARGLGASLQRQRKYKEAIKYHSRVLEISSRTGENSGSTDAYGAIADCYTELGDLEKAAKFYDKYIARLESD